MQWQFGDGCKHALSFTETSTAGPDMLLDLLAFGLRSMEQKKNFRDTLRSMNVCKSVPMSMRKSTPYPCQDLFWNLIYKQFYIQKLLLKGRFFDIPFNIYVLSFKVKQVWV